MGTLSRDEIIKMGFAAVGENVRLSSKASFYNCSQINIGDNVRIDDFCVLSAGTGGIRLGSNIHLAVCTTLIGKGAIVLEDFCNLSSRVAIYSSNDDYSGQYMTSPVIPETYTNVCHGDVILGKHVIIGCGSVVVGPVVLGEGVAVGALSLINRDCEEFGIYAGTPARLIKSRSKNLLQLERDFIDNVRR